MNPKREGKLCTSWQLCVRKDVQSFQYSQTKTEYPYLEFTSLSQALIFNGMDLMTWQIGGNL